ncbi:Titin [Nymphon striatum]|nr:Titin [Nymphon striatum]
MINLKKPLAVLKLKDKKKDEEKEEVPEETTAVITLKDKKKTTSLKKKKKESPEKEIPKEITETSPTSKKFKVVSAKSLRSKSKSISPEQKPEQPDTTEVKPEKFPVLRKRKSIPKEKTPTEEDNVLEILGEVMLRHVTTEKYEGAIMTKKHQTITEVESEPVQTSFVAVAPQSEEQPAEEPTSPISEAFKTFTLAVTPKRDTKEITEDTDKSEGPEEEILDESSTEGEEEELTDEERSKTPKFRQRNVTPRRRRLRHRLEPLAEEEDLPEEIAMEEFDEISEDVLDSEIIPEDSRLKATEEIETENQIPETKITFKKKSEEMPEEQPEDEEIKVTLKKKTEEVLEDEEITLKKKPEEKPTDEETKTTLKKKPEEELIIKKKKKESPEKEKPKEDSPEFSEDVCEEIKPVKFDTAEVKPSKEELTEINLKPIKAIISEDDQPEETTAVLKLKDKKKDDEKEEVPEETTARKKNQKKNQPEFSEEVCEEIKPVKFDTSEVKPSKEEHTEITLKPIKAIISEDAQPEETTAVLKLKDKKKDDEKEEVPEETTAVITLKEKKKKTTSIKKKKKESPEKEEPKEKSPEFSEEVCEEIKPVKFDTSEVRPSKEEHTEITLKPIKAIISEDDQPEETTAVLKLKDKKKDEEKEEVPEETTARKKTLKDKSPEFSEEVCEEIKPVKFDTSEVKPSKEEHTEITLKPIKAIISEDDQPEETTAVLKLKDKEKEEVPEETTAVITLKEKKKKTTSIKKKKKESPEKETPKEKSPEFSEEVCEEIKPVKFDTAEVKPSKEELTEITLKPIKAIVSEDDQPEETTAVLKLKDKKKDEEKEEVPEETTAVITLKEKKKKTTSIKKKTTSIKKKKKESPEKEKPEEKPQEQPEDEEIKITLKKKTEKILEDEEVKITLKKKPEEKPEDEETKITLKKKPEAKPVEQPEDEEIKVTLKKKPEEKLEDEEVKITLKKKQEEKPIDEEAKITLKKKPEEKPEEQPEDEEIKLTLKKKTVETPEDEEKKPEEKPEEQPEDEEIKVTLKKKTEEIPEDEEVKITLKKKPEEKPIDEEAKITLKKKPEEKPEEQPEDEEIKKPEEKPIDEEAKITLKKKPEEKPEQPEDEEIKITLKKKPEEILEDEEVKITLKKKPEEKPEDEETKITLKKKPREKPEQPEDEEIKVTLKKKPEEKLEDEEVKITLKKKPEEKPIDEEAKITLKKKPEERPHEQPEDEEIKLTLKKKTEEILEDKEVKITLKKKPEEKPEDEETKITLKKKPEEKPEDEEVKITLKKKPEEKLTEEEVKITLKKKPEEKPEEQPEDEEIKVTLKKKTEEKLETEETLKITLKKPEEKPQEHSEDEEIKLILKKKPDEKPEDEETMFTLKKKPEEIFEEEEMKITLKKKPEEKPEDEETMFTLKKKSEEIFEDEEMKITLKKKPEEKPEDEETMFTLKKKPEEIFEEEEMKITLKKKPEEKPEDEETMFTLKKKSEEIFEDEEMKITLKKKPEETPEDEETMFTLKKKPEEVFEDEEMKITLKKKPEDKPEDEETMFTLKKKPEEIFEDEEMNITLKKKPEEKPEDEETMFTLKKKPEEIFEDEEMKITLKKKPEEKPEDEETMFTLKKKPEEYFEDEEMEITLIKKFEELEETKSIIILRKESKEMAVDHDVETEITLKKKPKEKPEETEDVECKITLSKKLEEPSQEDSSVETTLTLKKPQSTAEDNQDVETKLTVDEKYQRKYSRKDESYDMTLAIEEDTSGPQYGEDELSLVLEPEIIEVEKIIYKEEESLIAMTTYISDQPDIMSIVEGERVYVIKKTTQDCWFVKKHLTNELGNIPKDILKDELEYTHYLTEKLQEKMQKNTKPKPGQQLTTPKFVKKLEDIKVSDGQTATFKCKVEGSPRPNITWFRQTAAIRPSPEFEIYYTEENVSELIIKEVFPEDAGTFTVVAKNVAEVLSRESSVADLFEGIPPLFSQRPQEKTVKKGEDAELECRLVGFPTPEITWMKNQKVLEESKKISVTTESDVHFYRQILKMKNVTVKDSGVYEIVARNTEGCSTTFATLIVEEPEKEIPKDEIPPSFTQTFGDVTVIEKETIKLTAKVTGKPTPEVTWFRLIFIFNILLLFLKSHATNRIPLEYTRNKKKLRETKLIKQTYESEICSLEITDATIDKHSGEYKCVATNPHGKVEHTAKIVINVTREDAEITWHKDGEKLNPSEKYEFVKEEKYRKLVVQNSNIFDEGEYTCVLGECECTSDLIVIELPPEIISKPEDLTVKKEETATLTVELTKGDALVKWYKGVKEVQLSERVQLKIDGKRQSLVVQQATTDDAGEYSCVVSDQKCTVKLRVVDPSAEFTGKLPDRIVSPPDVDAKFEVELNYPDVEVKWLRDGKEITGSEHFLFKKEGKKRELLLRSVSRDDMAEYTCIAGDAQTSTRFHVKEEFAEFTLTLQDTVVKESENVVMVVETTKLTEEVKWYKNGEPIVPDPTQRYQVESMGRQHKLVIRSASLDDMGLYSCAVEERECSAKLHVEVMDKGASSWPNVIPLKEQDLDLNKGEFIDALKLRYDIPLENLPSFCACGERFDVNHALKCKTGGFISRHDDIRDLFTVLLNKFCVDVECEPHLLPVTAEVMRLKSANTDKDARLDIKAKGFWRRGQTAFFDVRVTHVNSQTNANKDTKVVFKKHEQSKKREYLERVLEIEHASFTPLVFGTNGGMGTECQKFVSALATKLAEKQKEEYSVIISWLRVPPPKVNSEIRQFTVRRADTLLMDIPYSGFPAPTVEWTHEGEVLKIPTSKIIVETTEDRTVMYLKEMDENHCGSYSLTLRNEAGEDAAEFTVGLIADRPGAPGTPEVVRSTSDGLTLRWDEPPSDGGSEITNYVIEHHDRSTVRWTTYNEDFNVPQKHCTVTGLAEDSDYMFRVTAVNETGPGAPSLGTKYISFHNEEEGQAPVILEPLENVSAGVEETITLSCMIVGQPTPTVQWFKNGRELIPRKNIIPKHDGEFATLTIHDTTHKTAVPPRAEFDEDMLDVRLKARYEYNLEAKVTGYPLPNITWVKNKKPLESNKNILVRINDEKTSVTIFRVDREDSGTYSLRLSNDAGTKTYDFELRVLDKPSSPVGPIYFTDIMKDTVTIQWKPPHNDGGSDIKSYYLEKCDTKREVWVGMDTVDSSVTKYKISDLQEGREYMFRSIAENMYGQGEPLTSSPVTPKTIHDPPTAPTGPLKTSNVTDTSFTLSWNQPIMDGGAPVLEYTVERKEVGKKAWLKVGTTDGKTLTMEVTNMKKSSSYNFRITCTNEVGVSLPFLPEEAFTPGGEISPPSNPAGPLRLTKMSNKTMTIKWGHSANDGGSDIIGYVIEKKEDSSQWVTVVTTEAHVTSFTIPNLSNKYEYNFRVFAENAAGLSPPLESDDGYRLESTADKPTPPTGPLEMHCTGPSSVMIEWGHPESDGGAPISGYTVVMRDMCRTMWMEVGQVPADTQKLNIKDLQEGHEYMVRILARNEIGVSDPLESEEPIEIIRTSRYVALFYPYPSSCLDGFI